MPSQVAYTVMIRIAEDSEQRQVVTNFQVS
jgi:hypothetical protein